MYFHLLPLLISAVGAIEGLGSRRVSLERVGTQHHYRLCKTVLVLENGPWHTINYGDNDT